MSNNMLVYILLVTVGLIFAGLVYFVYKPNITKNDTPTETPIKEPDEDIIMDPADANVIVKGGRDMTKKLSTEDPELDEMIHTKRVQTLSIDQVESLNDYYDVSGQIDKEDLKEMMNDLKEQNIPNLDIILKNLAALKSFYFLPPQAKVKAGSIQSLKNSLVKLGVPQTVWTKHNKR